MVYKPIESYGVIGDLHTVALVGMDGSIHWCCLPHFDSPSIFAAILDEQKGGFFKIASLHEAQHKQMYLPDSNVLVTRFLSRDGVGEVIDFMPVQNPSRGKKTHQIVRVVRAVRGPYASGSNANPHSTTRDSLIRSLWKAAARCLNRRACAYRWLAAFRWRAKAPGSLPSSCCTRASHRHSSCARSRVMATPGWRRGSSASSC